MSAISSCVARKGGVNYVLPLKRDMMRSFRVRSMAPDEVIK